MQEKNWKARNLRVIKMQNKKGWVSEMRKMAYIFHKIKIFQQNIQEIRALCEQKNMPEIIALGEQTYA